MDTDSEEHLMTLSTSSTLNAAQRDLVDFALAQSSTYCTEDVITDPSAIVIFDDAVTSTSTRSLVLRQRGEGVSVWLVDHHAPLPYGRVRITVERARRLLAEGAL